MRKHAETELALMGYDEKCEDINLMMRNAVLELIDTFSKQGHSGYSAKHCINIFKKLANFEILIPLQCTDDEWCNVSNMSDEMYQNNRNPAVFKNKKDGNPYYLDAIVWREKDGIGFTGTVEGITSRQFIKIPFTPKTFYIDVIDVDDEHKIKDRKQLEEVYEHYYLDRTREVIVEKIV